MGDRCTAVLLVPPLVRRFLINFCRQLHYTSAMTGASLVAVNCSFDVLESGHAQEVSAVWFLLRLRIGLYSYLLPHSEPGTF